jgi:hypothetical protein
VTLSSTMGLGGEPAPVPDLRMIIAERDGQWRIVARQGACMACGGQGRVCYRCGGSGWEYLGGAEVTLGEPDETRVLEGGG